MVYYYISAMYPFRISEACYSTNLSNVILVEAKIQQTKRYIKYYNKNNPHQNRKKLKKYNNILNDLRSSNPECFI